MPTFAYTALDHSGKSVTGTFSARNKSEAYRVLETKSLVPVTLSQEDSAVVAAGKAEALASAKAGPVRLRTTEIILFTEELADLLDAGVQLEQGLRILHERQRNPSLKSVAGPVRNEIREGVRFSVALAKASPSFDDLYRNLVAAGEVSGSLDEILRRLATNLKDMHRLQRRVAGAMVYPAFLMIGCVALLFVFSTVLMPRLTELISKTGSTLPLVTKMLVAFSSFMASWWWAVLLGMVTIAVSFRVFIATKGGRLWWDLAKLRITLFGPVLSGRIHAQFCHTMANLLANGVPLLNALKLVVRSTPNLFVRNRLDAAVLEVGEGGSLSRSLAKTGAFDGGLVDRIAIGEQSGHLQNAFVKAARRYDEELDNRIQKLTALVPTIVLIFMALIIGVVAYSIITTIFGSIGGIRRQ